LCQVIACVPMKDNGKSSKSGVGKSRAKQGTALGKVQFVKEFPVERSLRKKVPPWVGQLKKRKGEWAVIFSSHGKQDTSSASSTASRMRTDVRYVGFEFRASGKEIYARWVGVPGLEKGRPGVAN
jgi:hypothetical protein